MPCRSGAEHGRHGCRLHSPNGTDAAGNTSAASNVVTVNIDKTKPTITAAATTAPNTAGWYNTDVTVQFTCTDGTGSGIPTGACPADQVLGTEGAAVASTAQTVTDAAGNTSAASNVVTVKIDKTAPVLTITTPQLYDVQPLGTALDFSANDALSELDGATMATLTDADDSSTAVDSGFVPGVGVYSIVVSATDVAGNTTTSAEHLLVIYDPSAGFVTGGGWIDSPAGAYTADPGLTGKASFGFVAKYKKGANVPDGNTGSNSKRVTWTSSPQATNGWWWPATRPSSRAKARSMARAATSS